jgi:hypothetical protein
VRNLCVGFLHMRARVQKDEDAQKVKHLAGGLAPQDKNIRAERAPRSDLLAFKLYLFSSAGTESSKKFIYKNVLCIRAKYLH